MQVLSINLEILMSRKPNFVAFIVLNTRNAYKNSLIIFHDQLIKFFFSGGLNLSFDFESLCAFVESIEPLSKV